MIENENMLIQERESEHESEKNLIKFSTYF